MIDLQTFDRPIAFHVSFARITGSVNAALFLSQAYYWANRTSDPDGWFYKTQEEWTTETYLSRREQEQARKTLRQLGIVEEKLVGVPARLYYKINHQRTLELLEKSDCPFSATEDVPNGQPRLSPTDKLDCTKPPNWIAPNRQTRLHQTAKLDCTKPPNYLYTEITNREYNREKDPPISPHGGEVVQTANREICKGEQPIDSQRGIQRLEQPTANEPENLVSPTSGKAVALSEREETNAAAPPLEKFLQDFNLYAPARWVRAKSLTVAYRKSLRRFIGQYGGDAHQLFVDGLQFAAQDKFLSSCDWDLCNWLSNDKPARYALRWAEVQSAKRRDYEEAMVYADKSLSPDERHQRLREIRERHGDSQDAWWDEVVAKVQAKLDRERGNGAGASDS
jgi:hypothetical protein